MGKFKNKGVGGIKRSRNVPLAEQLLEEKSVRPPGREKQRRRQEEEDDFADEKTTWKILQQARQQQEELQEEFGLISAPRERSKLSQAAVRDAPRLNKAVRSQSDSESSSSDDDDDDDDDEGFTPTRNDESGPVTEAADTIANLNDVCEEDEKAFEMFMSSDDIVKTTVAESLKEKLTAKQTELGSRLSDKSSRHIGALQHLGEKGDKMTAMLVQVREILPKYRSGALPKVFKVLPKFEAWEEILDFLQPDRWTAAAVYQATRIFISNLNDKMAQRFLNLFILPRIRDDIAEYKRLNFHLYQALRKALFKPGAFFKGLILPLCECGTCTLREATIVASVLAKNSVPLLHSAAAIIKIAEMDYNGANSIFLRTLLDKKYALPYQAVDAVVYHFLRFQTDRRSLPVLWHQSLLTFAQRYKDSISSEQRDALMALLRVQRHPQITDEVRRELLSAKCRDEPTVMDQLEPAAAAQSAVDMQ